MRGHAPMRRTVMGLLLAVGLIAAAGCRTPGVPHLDRHTFDPDDLEALSRERANFSRALALFSQGYSRELQQDIEGAIGLYRRVLDIDPDYHELYLRIALHHIRIQQFDQAAEIMDTLVRRNPRSAQAHIWKAFVHRAGDHTRQAMDAYRRALELDPGEVTPYLQLADMYVLQNKSDEAVRILKKGLEEAVETANLRRVLGDLYLRRAEEAKPEEAAAYQEEAIQLFKGALQEEPDDPSLLYSLGRLYSLTDRIDDAIPLFERIEALRPESMQVKWQLADTYAAADRPEDAIRVMEVIAERHPTNIQVYFRLGELYRGIGDHDKAMVNFRLATRTGRPDPAAYLNLALLQMETDPEGAVQSLLSGLELMPDNPRMVELMAYVYHEQEEYGKALRYFDRAESLFDERPDVYPTPNFYLFYAISSQYEDRIEEAAARLVTAIREEPIALDGFAHNAFQSEEPEIRQSALTVLYQAEKEMPENPHVPIYIAYLHSYEKEYDQALSAFNRAAGLARETGQEDALDATFYFWYAAANEREGDIERAEELFYECLERDPENAEAYNYLAYMWAEKGINLDRAYKYVTIALEQKPDSGAFIDTLGWIYYMQGEYEKAYDEIKRALELLPDDPTVLDHMGDIYFKLDDLDNAMTKWKRSFVIDPENEEVEDKLANHGADLEALREEAARREEKDPEDSDPAAVPEEEDGAPPVHDDVLPIDSENDTAEPDTFPPPEEASASPIAPDLFEPVTGD